MTVLALVYIAVLIVLVSGIIASQPRVFDGRLAQITVYGSWIIGLALAIGTLAR